MKSPLKTLKTRWRALSPADQRRYQIVGGVLFLGLLGLFHGLATSPALVKAEGDLSRVEARVAKASKKDAAPAVPRLGGKSAGQLAREVKGLETQMAIQKDRLSRLEPRFASMDNMQEHQALRLSITGLANSTDLELLKLEQKGIPKEERELAPTPERLAALAEANIYKRPLLHFEARASYRGLMQFLDGLAAMPFVASPVWIAVEVKTDAQNGQPPKRQWLEVAMDLAL